MRCAKRNRRICEAAPSTRDSRGPAIKRAADGIAAVSLPEEATQRPFVVNGLKSNLVKLFGDTTFSGENFFEKRVDFLNGVLICYAYVDMTEAGAYPHALNKYDKMTLTGFIITLGYYQADGLETWKPSIVKFLRDCGFEEVMLDKMIGFGVDLQNSDDVLQAERNLFKALKQFNERKDLAQKSYKTTSSMSDREYSIYKGLAPSDDCAIDWWCGTGHFKVILSPSNELIIEGENATYPLKKSAPGTPDWAVASTNSLVKAIWRATELNDLLDKSDLEPLKDLLIAQEYMDASDPDGDIAYSDAIEACSDFVEQELVNAGIIKYVGSMVDFTNLDNVAAACEAITRFLASVDLIPPGGKAKVKRTVNKNRKHRITANPNLKAIGESRRFARRGR